MIMECPTCSDNGSLTILEVDTGGDDYVYCKDCGWTHDVVFEVCGWCHGYGHARGVCSDCFGTGGGYVLRPALQPEDDLLKEAVA